jgi:hypothetical protein
MHSKTQPIMLLLDRRHPIGSGGIDGAGRRINDDGETVG